MWYMYHIQCIRNNVGSIYKKVVIHSGTVWYGTGVRVYSAVVLTERNTIKSSWYYSTVVV